MPKSDSQLDDTFRFDDASKFLQVYLKTQDVPAEKRENFKDLFQGLGAHSTTLGQLTRLLEFLFPPGKPGVPAPGETSMALLFRVQADGGLGPTKLSQLLYQRLQILGTFCSDIRGEATDLLGGDRYRRVVRVGAPQTIAIRLLAFAFSDPDVIGSDIRLDVEIGNSHDDLIPRLRLGQIDFAIAYGHPERDRPDRDPRIQFADLGYRLRMVMIAHPKAKIQLRDSGRDANQGYWEKAYAMKSTKAKGRPNQREVLYKDMRQIAPADVDFSATTLIAVPSWNQPAAIQDVVDRARRHNNVTEVKWYDEALALCRMGVGIAVVPEVLAARRLVTTFRLENPEAYARPIAVYYDARRGLSADACRVVEFLRSYLQHFSTEVSSKYPPALGDDGYPEKIPYDSTLPDDAWEKLSIEKYPTLPLEPTKRRQ